MMILSLPIRERGLKLRGLQELTTNGRVAPYTGAWIETLPHPAEKQPESVAPYTGAWIETLPHH